jgi:hypothetical protein
MADTRSLTDDQVRTTWARGDGSARFSAAVDDDDDTDSTDTADTTDTTDTADTTDDTDTDDDGDDA